MVVRALRYRKHTRAARQKAAGARPRPILIPLAHTTIPDPSSIEEEGSAEC
jgi:hypothetical protein